MTLYLSFFLLSSPVSLHFSCPAYKAEGHHPEERARWGSIRESLPGRVLQPEPHQGQDAGGCQGTSLTLCMCTCVCIHFINSSKGVVQNLGVICFLAESLFDTILSTCVISFSQHKVQPQSPHNSFCEFYLLTKFVQGGSVSHYNLSVSSKQSGH